MQTIISDQCIEVLVMNKQYSLQNSTRSH